MNRTMQTQGNEEQMDRKTFLIKLGRFSIFFSLLGLGTFLFKRNTCTKPEISTTSTQSPCKGCEKLDACHETQAETQRNEDRVVKG